MKFLLLFVAAAFANPEADPEADPYLLYGGGYNGYNGLYRGYNSFYNGLQYPYGHHGYPTVKYVHAKPAEAVETKAVEEDTEVEPAVTPLAHPFGFRHGYYPYSQGVYSHGYGYGYPTYGHYGYKAPAPFTAFAEKPAEKTKRSADPEAEADADAYYGYAGYGHAGYGYGHAGYGHAGYPYGLRSYGVGYPYHTGYYGYPSVKYVYPTAAVTETKTVEAEEKSEDVKKVHYFPRYFGSGFGHYYNYGR